MRGRFVGERGKRSAADLSTVVIPGQRPPAPDDLTPEQKTKWDQIVERLPADWFTAESFPLLRLLVQHISFARVLGDEAMRLLELAREIDDPKAWQRARPMLRAHAAQTDKIVSLSTRLKLTQRSRYMRRADAAGSASRGGGAPKPWVDWGDRHQ
jgi:hypothetical protein